jgi:hypothetical protein
MQEAIRLLAGWPACVAGECVPHIRHIGEEKLDGPRSGRLEPRRRGSRSFSASACTSLLGRSIATRPRALRPVSLGAVLDQIFTRILADGADLDGIVALAGNRASRASRGTRR